MRKYQNQKRSSVSKNQRGATAVIVGASIFALVGFAALVVDLGNLYVARNELQNAADAGALAGARMLYNDNGTEINCVDVDGDDSKSANKVAYSVATANFSQNQSVDVNWTSGTSTTNNNEDVQRGHWSFGRRPEDLAKGFYPSNLCELTDLWNVSFDVLDADPDFINAVRVVARRQATPVASFFARIFGYENFEVSAEAVGYIGFAGSINPKELDLPLALCEDSILVDDKYSCNIGRMINSGGNDGTNDTGRWTNFSSGPDENPEKCETDNTDSNDFNIMEAQLEKEGKTICDGGLNTDIIYGGDELSTNNGEMNILSTIYECFVNEPYEKKRPWEVTLPVIDCSSDPGCAIVKGAVTVTIVWVNVKKNYAEAPIAMEGMRYSEEEGGGYVLDDDGITPLYEDWGTPLNADNEIDLSITVNSGENDSLYVFMQGLDDYVSEHWNDRLIAAFGADWYTKPLADFFKVADMTTEEPTEEEKAAGKVRWASFIRHFNLKNVIVTENEDGVEVEVAKPAPFAFKSIYFLPDCSGHELAGRTGGENFGVLAEIPALVH
jgi:Flp pilus assembly protein TadG